MTVILAKGAILIFGAMVNEEQVLWKEVLRPWESLVGKVTRCTTPFTHLLGVVSAGSSGSRHDADSEDSNFPLFWLSLETCE